MGDWNDENNWVEGVIPNNDPSATGTKYKVIINDETEGVEGPVIDNLNITINELIIAEPDGGDNFVEIRSGATLKIDSPSGLNSKGTITVKSGGKLTLDGGTSKSKLIKLVGVEGTATKATLRIDSDTTLEEPDLGVGCEIIGKDDDDDTSGPGCSGCPGPTPEDPDAVIDGDGELTITANGLIHGELEIRAKLVNNGVVDADDAAAKIFLSTTSKSGGEGGEWKATKGLLDVDVNVTGCAGWTIQETGFLQVDGGDIEGTDFNFLNVNNTNPWLFLRFQTITVAGNLDITMKAAVDDENTCPFPADPEGSANNQWLMSGGSIWKFTGGDGGDPNNFVTLEVAAKDHGVGQAPCDVWDAGFFAQCMAMGVEVIIAPGARVKLVNNRTNENDDGQHCSRDHFRAEKLTFEDEDGRLDLNNNDAHFFIISGDGEIEGNPQCACP